jgi:hypothetical protein
MDFGSLLLIGSLLILVALVVARPLITGEQFGPGRDSQSSHWLAERERALEALLELDFDREMDKVPEAVYAEQRARLVAQAAEAMQALDDLAAADPDSLATALDEKRAATMSDAQLDKLLAARRKARRR